MAVVHSDLVPLVEAQQPERLRIVEVAVPPEVAEEFALGTVALTGRYPAAEQLIEGNDPPTESVLTPPMSVSPTQAVGDTDHMLRGRRVVAADLKNPADVARIRIWPTRRTCSSRATGPVWPSGWAAPASSRCTRR